jgi:hypothetical protein
MVHAYTGFENFEFDSRLKFDQHLGSHKHVINIIMGFRDMRCYTHHPAVLLPAVNLPPSHSPTPEPFYPHRRCASPTTLKRKINLRRHRR